MVNRIARVHRGEASYRWLRLNDRPQPLGVTPSHAFYLPDEQVYRPIGEVLEGTRLLRRGSEIEPSLREPCRVRHYNGGGHDPIFNIHMEREPHNFFIEGLLVHNVGKA